MRIFKLCACMAMIKYMGILLDSKEIHSMSQPYR